MTTKGLIVTLHARDGKEGEVANFLSSASELVQNEQGTTAWFALRVSPAEFIIVDVFPDDAARDAHLAGSVAAALFERADELFTEPPGVQRVDVLSAKLPGDSRGDEQAGWEASEWASTGKPGEHGDDHGQDPGWQASEWAAKDLPGDGSTNRS